jgi:hypothetical protein
VPTGSQALLGACDATNLCVPKYFVERNAKFIAPSCTSVNGAEGRCLSKCIPQIAAQATLLPQATCDAGDLCAPCFDPRTGADTGACKQGCDPGPTQAPKPFEKCCGGQGSCVPTSLVPTADQTLLGFDTCSDRTKLCAPDKLSNPTYIPKTCKSIDGFEGRCMADCIPNVAAQASRLPKDVCDTGELCAPCYDPITGADTGACTQNGDSPKDTKQTFAACCGSLGHCVPTSILTTAQQAELGKDTCTSSGDLCAPDVFATAGATPPVCRAMGSLNAEGRCIPACVPSVAAQKDRLDQGTPKTCADGTLCAPCYDPTTGADTGACTQNGDTPHEAVKLYPTCCKNVDDATAPDLGSCVPASLVPPSQSSQLGQDTCTDASNLCAPKEFADPTAKPATCTFPGNVEARCMPACLPAIVAQKNLLTRETCASGERCAPCYNPLDGTDTGACEVNGDKPANAPVKYAGCCAYNGTNRGTCVPPALVSTSQASSLPQDTCATGFLCAPNLKVKDQTAKFVTCNAGLLGTGACVPSCIPNPVQAIFLTQGTCQAGELCAPCSFGGTSTGACD